MFKKLYLMQERLSGGLKRTSVQSRQTQQIDFLLSCLLGKKETESHCQSFYINAEQIIKGYRFVQDSTDEEMIYLSIYLAWYNNIRVRTHNSPKN